MNRPLHSSPLFLVIAIVGALVAGACLLPGLTGAFIFDDGESIVRNQAIHLTRLNAEDLAYAAYSFQPGHGSRALSMLTFALDYWHGGLNPRGFKLTNILIHTLTTLVLAGFLRSLLLAAKYPPPLAAAGACAMATAWGLHPLQVSSVLYVVQRMQTLVTLFMLLALWAYLKMRQAQLLEERSRGYGALTGLFWVLGLASKEDALLFPLYSLAVEITILNYAAASTRTALLLRRGYAALVAIGLVGSVVLLVHYWHWGAYPSRDFSSAERLLTQGRVLVLYLSQIVLPFPASLHFYYDDFIVSRGWLQPPSTVVSWVGLAALLGWAWHWRKQRPLFALGVFIFFAGHSLTSSVLNLELVFEHRNHLPLVGALLAIGDLFVFVWIRLGWGQRWAAPLVGAILLGLAAVTANRAYTWGEPLRFAAKTLMMAPHSERAWATLGAAYVDRSGFKPGPWLDRAIDVNLQGANATQSAILLSNVVIYKTIRGDVTPSDWTRLETSLKHVTMNAQNKVIAINLLNNAERGMPLDREAVVRVLEIVKDRIEFTPNEYLRMSAFINNKTDDPDRAFPFLRLAVQHAMPNDPDIAKMLLDLEDIGRGEWAVQLRALRSQQRLNKGE